MLLPHACFVSFSGVICSCLVGSTRLDPSIYEAMQKEGVAVGDVVYIEANSGAVKRVGRSDAYATVSRKR